MPNSYDCSRNALTDRIAAQRAQQADDRHLRERFAAIEKRLVKLENWQDAVDAWGEQ